MALQGLTLFLIFQILEFLKGKRFLYVKSSAWKDGDTVLGSKVVLQIIEDRTAYPKPNISNFGEQLTIKVRNTLPEAFAQLKPLATEVIIKDIERAVVFGEYKNQLSVIGTIAVNEAAASN
ncbi:MAG: hypothetical protein K2M42_02075 [Oscillospiraceae bacterium]|nr:hypothetical protein [Oscillospiraceae bacterium]